MYWRVRVLTRAQSQVPLWVPAQLQYPQTAENLRQHRRVPRLLTLALV